MTAPTAIYFIVMYHMYRVQSWLFTHIHSSLQLCTYIVENRLLDWTGSQEKLCRIPRRTSFFLLASASDKLARAKLCSSRKKAEQRGTAWRPWRESAFVLSYTRLTPSISLDFAPLPSVYLLTFLRKATGSNSSSSSFESPVFCASVQSEFLSFLHRLLYICSSQVLQNQRSFFH